jgi:hypothetical protein
MGSMARRQDKPPAEVLTEKDLKDLRYNLAHLSVSAVRQAYERAYEDCRLIYSRVPTPKQMQILVQVWRQLWRWR